MADMLVRLYELDGADRAIADQAKRGIIIRKPIGPEKNLIVEWVAASFSPGWASEADIAMCRQPASCFVAIREKKPIGFACYDATALGFFGPIAVLETCRKQGTGGALLLACLNDMKARGYGYAVIGSAGARDFYMKTAGAFEIPGSDPGIFATWLRKENQ